MEAPAEQPGLTAGSKDKKAVDSKGHEMIDVKYEEKVSSSRGESFSTDQEDDELKSAKAEVGQVKMENERLKKMLEKIENDYRSLQMRFFNVLERDPPPKLQDMVASDQVEEPEVSLCLGRSPIESRSDSEKPSNSGKTREHPKLAIYEELTLGLDLRYPLETYPLETDTSEIASEELSPEKEDTKEDETGDNSSPSKQLKRERNGSEDLPQPNIEKRARVSIRARCDTPTMNDGCQWRKYGQKISKGNPCPRAYYRCTVAPSCPVRKQVQRCPEDMSILVTTYEGAHNHPLPVAARAMASTTSAAASVLISGSSTSQGGASSSTNINGFNFTLFDTSRTRPFNLPGASSAAPPTITLDLTSTSSTHTMNRVSQIPKFSTTSLDFSFSEAAKPPTAWAGSYLNNYPSAPYSKTPMGILNFAKPPPNLMEHPMNNTNASQASSSSQQLLTETLTRVLSSDPSFQSAVAAAISSMVGSGNITNTSRASDSSTYNSVKWSANADNNQNQMSGVSPANLAQQIGKACASSYLSMPSQSTSSAALSGSFMHHQPPFPFSISKSSSSTAPNAVPKDPIDQSERN